MFNKTIRIFSNKSFHKLPPSLPQYEDKSLEKSCTLDDFCCGIQIKGGHAFSRSQL